jgi:hypothetical protein
MSDLSTRKYPDKYPAFVTGSRAIGGSTKNSDIDLVIFVDNPITEELLETNSDRNGIPVYYGSLNLLICNTPEKYLFWKKALSLCIEQSTNLARDLTKEERCEIHENLAKELGIPFKNGKPTDYDPD